MKKLTIVVFLFLALILDGSSQVIAGDSGNVKKTIQQLQFESTYVVGRQIAEGIVLSIVVGMSAYDEDLAFSNEILESTFSSGEHTWPIMNVSISTESGVLGNNDISFILLLELTPDATVVGTVKNAKSGNGDDDVMSSLNNTMFVETEDGTEQVQLVDGELYFVE